MNLLLEVIAVLLNLIYLVLLIKEKIACWFFGITASAISIYLFYDIGLYSEAILYFYYVVIGVYGYTLWNKKKKEEESLKVQTISLQKHFFIILLGSFLTVILGAYFQNNTDAVNPYLDAFTTSFSIIASVLEARKILSVWFFWIIINIATIVLYIDQHLNYYLALTMVYTVFSVLGYLEWRKKYQFYKLKKEHLKS